MLREETEETARSFPTSNQLWLHASLPSRRASTAMVKLPLERDSRSTIWPGKLARTQTVNADLRAGARMPSLGPAAKSSLPRVSHLRQYAAVQPDWSPSLRMLIGQAVLVIRPCANVAVLTVRHALTCHYGECAEL